MTTTGAGSVGLGIVGCGSVARAYRAAIRNLEAEGKARLVACCDALALAEQARASKRYTLCARCSTWACTTSPPSPDCSGRRSE